MNNNESVYEKTLRLLEENGWQQGNPVGPHGEMCLAVAYQAACGGQSALDLYRDTALGRGYMQMGSLMRQQYGDHVTIVEFNDDPQTTFEDVAMLLKECDERFGPDVPAPQ